MIWGKIYGVPNIRKDNPRLIFVLFPRKLYNGRWIFLQQAWKVRTNTCSTFGDFYDIFEERDEAESNSYSRQGYE